MACKILRTTHIYIYIYIYCAGRRGPASARGGGVLQARGAAGSCGRAGRRVSLVGRGSSVPGHGLAREFSQGTFSRRCVVEAEAELRLRELTQQHLIITHDVKYADNISWKCKKKTCHSII